MFKGCRTGMLKRLKIEVKLEIWPFLFSCRSLDPFLPLCLYKQQKLLNRRAEKNWLGWKVKAADLLLQTHLLNRRSPRPMTLPIDEYYDSLRRQK
jgi:hypothetical protein